ncbi:hypothetical protein HDU96_007065, partial [Phlyctochytrium bullatum]
MTTDFRTTAFRPADAAGSAAYDLAGRLPRGLVAHTHINPSFARRVPMPWDEEEEQRIRKAEEMKRLEDLKRAGEVGLDVQVDGAVGEGNGGLNTFEAASMVGGARLPQDEWIKDITATLRSPSRSTTSTYRLRICVFSPNPRSTTLRRHKVVVKAPAEDAFFHWTHRCNPFSFRSMVKRFGWVVPGLEVDADEGGNAKWWRRRRKEKGEQGERGGQVVDESDESWKRLEREEAQRRERDLALDRAFEGFGDVIKDRVRECLLDPKRYVAIVEVLSPGNAMTLTFQEVVNSYRNVDLLTLEFEPSPWKQVVADLRHDFGRMQVHHSLLKSALIQALDTVARRNPALLLTGGVPDPRQPSQPKPWKELVSDLLPPNGKDSKATSRAMKPPALGGDEFLTDEEVVLRKKMFVLLTSPRDENVEVVYIKSIPVTVEGYPRGSDTSVRRLTFTIYSKGPLTSSAESYIVTLTSTADILFNFSSVEITPDRFRKLTAQMTVQEIRASAGEPGGAGGTATPSPVLSRSSPRVRARDGVATGSERGSSPTRRRESASRRSASSLRASAPVDRVRVLGFHPDEGLAGGVVGLLGRHLAEGCLEDAERYTATLVVEPGPVEEEAEENYGEGETHKRRSSRAENSSGGGWGWKVKDRAKGMAGGRGQSPIGQRYMAATDEEGPVRVKLRPYRSVPAVRRGKTGGARAHRRDLEESEGDEVEVDVSNGVHKSSPRNGTSCASADSETDGWARDPFKQWKKTIGRSEPPKLRRAVLVFTERVLFQTRTLVELEFKEGKREQLKAEVQDRFARIKDEIDWTQYRLDALFDTVRRRSPALLSALAAIPIPRSFTSTTARRLRAAPTPAGGAFLHRPADGSPRPPAESPVPGDGVARVLGGGDGGEKQPRVVGRRLRVGGGEGATEAWIVPTQPVVLGDIEAQGDTPADGRSSPTGGGRLYPLTSTEAWGATDRSVYDRRAIVLGREDGMVVQERAAGGEQRWSWWQRDGGAGSSWVPSKIPVQVNHGGATRPRRAGSPEKGVDRRGRPGSPVRKAGRPTAVSAQQQGGPRPPFGSTATRFAVEAHAGPGSPGKKSSSAPSSMVSSAAVVAKMLGMASSKHLKGPTQKVGLAPTRQNASAASAATQKDI